MKHIIRKISALIIFISIPHTIFPNFTFARPRMPVGPTPQRTAADISDGIIKTSELIQKYKKLLAALHHDIDIKARAQLAIPQETIHQLTPLPREIAGIVSEYSGTKCIDYNQLLIDTMAPILTQVNELNKEMHAIAAKSSGTFFGGIRDKFKFCSIKETEIKRWQNAGYKCTVPIGAQHIFRCNACDHMAIHLPYLYGDFSRGLSYKDPADYHDYTKPHSPEIQNSQASAIQDRKTLNDCSDMPTPTDNEQFLRYVLRRFGKNVSFHLEQPKKSVPKDILDAANGFSSINSSYSILHSSLLWAIAQSNIAQLNEMNLKTYEEVQLALEDIIKKTKAAITSSSK
jgi:hypothetical protein